MLNSFGHQALRWRRRFLIDLGLVLVLVAVPVESSLVELPPTTAAVQPEADGSTRCDCKHIKAIQAELSNALGLQQAFQGKIADLQKIVDGLAANAEFNKFAKATADRFSRPAGDTGPKSVEYTPYGESVDTGILNAEKNTKKTAKEIEERRNQLCGLSGNAKLEIADMKAGAVCAGIVEAVVAHEGVHWASCLRLGYLSFRDMHAADRAQEEVEAYGAQIKVLRDTLASLRCGYRATGQTADTKYSGVVCSLEQPFTVTGTNPAMTYPFMFVPSSVTKGTVSFQATTTLPISASGSGTYTIEGADTEKPHILMTMGSTGVTPVGTRSGGGTVRIDLVRLESGECDGK